MRAIDARGVVLKAREAAAKRGAARNVWENILAGGIWVARVVEVDKISDGLMTKRCGVERRR